MDFPTFPTGSLESWLLPAAFILSLVALAKKVFPAPRPDDQFVTKDQFQTELSAIRDKIDARFFCLTEKIDRLGNSLLDRLAEVERSVSRLDERTK